MTGFRTWSRLPNGVKNLIIINVIVYIAQLLIDFVLSRSHLLTQSHITAVFSLIPQSVLEGYIWQLFTYQFLHGGPFHLALNMFALWNFGPELEDKWGSKFFIKYFLICGFGAGIFIFVMPIILSQNLFVATLGSSGSVFGVLLAYTLYWPDRYLLWFFVPMKMKYFALIIGIFSLFFTFQTTGGGGGISHVGHLGGLITGYLYLLYKMKSMVYSEAGYRLPPQANIFKTLWRRVVDAQKRRQWKERQKKTHEEANMEEKLDSLLEKISRYGMKSLSAKEKKFLKNASEKIDRHPEDTSHSNQS